MHESHNCTRDMFHNHGLYCPLLDNFEYIIRYKYTINVFLNVFCIVVTFQYGVENSRHNQKHFNQILSLLNRKLNNSAFIMIII